jgi:hypothetical protein
MHSKNAVKGTKSNPVDQYGNSTDKRLNRLRLAAAPFDSHILKTRRITESEYLNMWSKQEGKCAICGIPEHRCSKGKLFIDHNHVTNKVRGLLCSNCNSGIGFLKDNIGTLLKAIEYLS